jgi:small nuclear ribonucleoprotein D3
MSNIGVPIKMLHEAEGHIVTCEVGLSPCLRPCCFFLLSSSSFFAYGRVLCRGAQLMSGEMYRGKLVEAEDNMNCQLTDIMYTARDGRVTQLESVYIRGSKLRFIVVPDMLRNAPMFKVKAASKAGANRNKSALLRAQGK